jgi:hypothetical protein
VTFLVYTLLGLAVALALMWCLLMMARLSDDDTKPPED